MILKAVCGYLLIGFFVAVFMYRNADPENCKKCEETINFFHWMPKLTTFLVMIFWPMLLFRKGAK